MKAKYFCNLNIQYIFLIEIFCWRYLLKLYPDIGSLKFINGILSIPFELATKRCDLTTTSSEPNNNMTVNIFNQKSSTFIWSTRQLEPFTSKILNRDNYDGVLSVLQELDTVSQRQPVILSYFVFYLQPLMQDLNDNLRDISLALIMRYLRLNPKLVDWKKDFFLLNFFYLCFEIRETTAFFQSFAECLTSGNSKIYTSAIKVFSDFNILCSGIDFFILMKIFDKIQSCEP